LGEIVFIGLGLNDETGISLHGLEEIKTAQQAFIELYTSLLPDFSLKHLEQLTRKNLNIVSRKNLEDENGKIILDAAKKGKVVLLVPGDPLIATTHVTLRIDAEKRGIKTRIVHGASILSAIIGLSGLHNYKFGRTVTIPFQDEAPTETPYNVIAQNQKLQLHTLCLLDIKTEQERYLTINEALTMLLKHEQKKKSRVITENTLAIGIARAGSNNPTVKANRLKDLISHDFGKPPHSIVFPGKLHFMEAEALIHLADAPKQLVKEMTE
jgi:diphthine synthase